MKKFTLFLTALVFAVYLSSCKKKEKEDATPSVSDKIEITNVEHTGTLEDGELVNFKISGTYVLNTLDSANISLGFNNWSNPDSYIMIDEIVIYKGSGTFSFDKDATVKDWGNEAAFNAYVNIGKITTSMYFPTANDYHTIIAKD